MRLFKVKVRDTFSTNFAVGNLQVSVDKLQLHVRAENTTVSK